MHETWTEGHLKCDMLEVDIPCIGYITTRGSVISYHVPWKPEIPLLVSDIPLTDGQSYTFSTSVM